MREIELPPFAPSLVESMRAMGYSLESAIADIIDNSIAANARSVAVMFDAYDDDPSVAIIDDGIGLTSSELTHAMQHGSQDPRANRAASDLGRFGLGLKTASLSQCRKLTVVSRRNGVTRDSPLRSISDASDIFPYGHKSTQSVELLPPSLAEAVRCFILSNAVRDLRGEGSSHRSMLVNVSRFTNVQRQVARLLDDLVREMQGDIQNYSRLQANKAIKNRTLQDLRSTFEVEFSNVGFTWDAVQGALVSAALPKPDREGPLSE